MKGTFRGSQKITLESFSHECTRLKHIFMLTYKFHINFVEYVNTEQKKRSKELSAKLSITLLSSFLLIGK